MRILFIVLILLLIITISISVYIDTITFKRPKNKIYPGSTNKNYLKLNKLQNAAKERLLKIEHEHIFITSYDGTKLHAIYFQSKHKTNQTILCAHGYRSTGLDDFSIQCEFLLTQDCNVLVVDNRAHGQSEGQWIGFSILDSYDVLKWCDYLVNQNKDVEIILFGQSMGGATCINAAANPTLSKQVVGLITDSAFDSGYDVMYRNFSRKIKLPVKFFMPFDNFVLKFLAGYSLKDKEAYKEIDKVKVPTLIIHGDFDHLVPISSAKVLFDNSKAQKELLIIQNADHMLGIVENPKAYQDAIIQLIQKTSK